jgi:hypothetical protein
VEAGIISRRLYLYQINEGIEAKCLSPGPDQHEMINIVFHVTLWVFHHSRYGYYATMQRKYDRNPLWIKWLEYFMNFCAGQEVTGIT